MAARAERRHHRVRTGTERPVSLGYNGRGVAMATAMGIQVAKRPLGTPAEALDMPVTDLKEIPFHGLWKQAAARIVYGRICDRLGI